MKGFLESNFKPDEPLRRVANVQQQNRVANVLMQTKGIGCTIQRNYGAQGFGWYIVCADNSDIAVPGGIKIAARTFSVDSTDKADYGQNQFTGSDSVAYDSTHDIPVRFDIFTHTTDTGDSANKSIRMHLKVAAKGTPVEALCRTAAGTLVWAELTDTCTPPP
jgi:hypothetical protein